MAFTVGRVCASLSRKIANLHLFTNQSANFYKWPTNNKVASSLKWKCGQSLRRLTSVKAGVGNGKRGWLRGGLLVGGSAVVGFYAGEIIKSTAVLAADASPANIKPSRSILYPDDSSDLKLVIYQYQTCPFCCKVRAFLDYNRISYDVVEVDPVMRQQIKFSKWRKVPIVLVKHKGSAEYQQLNDSSLIVSVLKSYLLDPRRPVEQLMDYYPAVNYKNDGGKEVTEILNRYHVMHGESQSSDDQQTVKERRWRMWADDTLVHTLSPNVYRTPGEALQAFRWFSRVGEWENNFPWWEKTMVIYVGAAAMYLIGKRLKKRHHLEDDVRQSLYKACDEWVDAMDPLQPFMGGQRPNLADLAVFGVLNSIEGCTAFAELLSNSRIGSWFSQMKAVTGSSRLTSSSSQ